MWCWRKKTEWRRRSFEGCWWRQGRWWRRVQNWFKVSFGRWFSGDRWFVVRCCKCVSWSFLVIWNNSREKTPFPNLALRFSSGPSSPFPLFYFSFFWYRIPPPSIRKENIFLTREREREYFVVNPKDLLGVESLPLSICDSCVYEWLIKIFFSIFFRFH